MLVRSAAITALVGLPLAAGYSYDPDAADGPPRWSLLLTDGENQCDGKSNSPIAIESMECTDFEKYEMQVSNTVYISCLTSVSPRHGI